MWRRLLAVAAGLTVSLGIGNPQSALAGNGNGNGNGNPNPGVTPPQASAFGNSYAEWSAMWWQWAYSLPTTMHPLFDTADCGAGQLGNVWFLGGKFTFIPSDVDEFLATADRTCAIPSGTALFFPILNAACTEVQDMANEDDLRACANSIQDHAVDVQATITRFVGEAAEMEMPLEIPDLEFYRVESPFFETAPLPAGNLGDEPEGTILKIVGDGIYLMLAPLPVGTHALQFEGTVVFSEEAGDDFDLVFELDITYGITVVPNGQYQPPAP